MDFFLQQEGSLGLILFIAALLVGLLYLILPVFIWRIWYWSRQNSRQLEELNTNLKLLIRDIAPDALPPADFVGANPEESVGTGEELAPAGMAALSESGESDLLSEERTGFDFSEESEHEDSRHEESMDFSMSDEFEDVSDELATSEIADFTGETGEDKIDEAGAARYVVQEDDEDELVMDFEGADDSTTDEAAAAFSEDIASAPAEEKNEADDFDFPQPSATLPSEISVSDGDFSDFTVEHFESNEEKSFEFEDIDDDFFSSDGNSSAGQQTSAAETESPTDAAPKSDVSTAPESTAENIWGDEDFFSPDEKTGPSPETADQSASDFSFGIEAGDEPPAAEPRQEKEEIGDVANSFLSDLEKKLNLDTMATGHPAPEPKPITSPAVSPEPEPPAPSQSTLFARCEGCGHKLAYKQPLSGKRVRCPACRTAFTLP